MLQGFAIRPQSIQEAKGTPSKFKKEAIQQKKHMLIADSQSPSIVGNTGDNSYNNSSQVS